MYPPTYALEDQTYLVAFNIAYVITHQLET